MREELELHRAEIQRALEEGGMRAADAALESRRRMGNMTLAAEDARQVWIARSVDVGVQDVRYALRGMRKAPVFTVTAVLTLAIGIGGATAMFSLVEAIYLRPLPVEHPDQLVLFSRNPLEGSTCCGPPGSRSSPDGEWRAFSTKGYEVLRDAHLPLQGVAAFSGSYDSIAVQRSNGDGLGGWVADLVSGNFFALLGVRPIVGRALAPEDDVPGAAPVAVLSEHFWRLHLNSDPHILGAVLAFNRLPMTVVGVMPESFFGVRLRRPEAWIPLVWQPQIQESAPVNDRVDYDWLQIIGRRGPGQTQPPAESAATAVLRRFLLETSPFAASVSGRTGFERARVMMASGERGISDFRAGDVGMLTLLMVGVGLVLVIASANVATLLLCRGTARRPEIAMRRALGASGGRLVCQWCTEALVLAVTGAGGAALIADWTTPMLVSVFPTGPVPITLNSTVFLFTTATTLCAAIVFGLAPALEAGRVDPLSSLRGGTQATRRTTRKFGASEPFVIVQLAMSLVLVLGATLFVRTLRNLEGEPLGFDQKNVLLVRINPLATGYSASAVGSVYRRLYDRISTLPGVESATFARYSPFGGYLDSSTARVEGYTPAPGEEVRLETVEVGPNYPQTLGMPILQGRAINLDDTGSAPAVAMVNEAFARRFFPKSTPLGHSFDFFNQRQYRIVGVVKDALFHDARDPAVPFVFMPMLQDNPHAFDCEIELRTSGDATALAAVVRQTINAVDSRVAVRRVTTLHEQVAATFLSERLLVRFVGVFAAIALLLAAIGVYGVVSHSVAGRTKEIGIRIAIGATAGDVIWLVIRETLACAAVALVAGLVASEIGGRTLRAWLFGISALDPVSLAIAVGALVLITVLASLVPAGRAVGVQPVTALRTE